MIDWLIDNYLTSSEQYLVYIQDENNYITYENHIEMREGVGQPGQQCLAAAGKVLSGS
jgi:hypothetical protein